MKKKSTEKLECTILTTYGYLNNKENKILAKVRWGNNEPKFDIRKCYRLENGELQLGAGISLTDEEFQALIELREQEESKKVNFNEVFDEASGITEKRYHGCTTKDGYIVLNKRKK